MVDVTEMCVSRVWHFPVTEICIYIVTNMRISDISIMSSGNIMYPSSDTATPSVTPYMDTWPHQYIVNLANSRMVHVLAEFTSFKCQK